MDSNNKLYTLADLNPRPEHWYLLNMSLSGEGGRSGRFGVDKTLFILPRIKPRLVHSLV
jgi:hypothetical protein